MLGGTRQLAEPQRLRVPEEALGREGVLLLRLDGGEGLQADGTGLAARHGLGAGEGGDELGACAAASERSERGGRATSEGE